ncbi:MAG: lysine-2,3-aminomutase-like protein [Alphaproteobacteria bacterium]|nr:lysine-2,3-aminomutase-like protein [Alphaproteobacteria bacterium]
MQHPATAATPGPDGAPPDTAPPARGPVRDADALVAVGVLDPAERAIIEDIGETYTIGVTPSMLALIDRADPADPIARQFVPTAAEAETRPEERADPIGDDAHSPLPGLVHRYPDRVLLKPMHACPVYCRFCFRRERVGRGGAAMSAAELDAALAYIAARPQIFEVVITGGDPLILAPRRLAALVAALDRIPHIGSIRLHTRVPVVDPPRVTGALAAALGGAVDTAVWVAVHTNHPRELTPAARAALGRLRGAGVGLVSQTVLLNGVNAEVETLATLFRDLVRAGVKPYYLHHPDLAPGTAHFRLSLGRGRALYRALRGRVSGLALPAYVIDIPGGFGKVPVEPGWVDGDDATGWTLTDPAGRRHAYPPVPLTR